MSPIPKPLIPERFILTFLVVSLLLATNAPVAHGAEQFPLGRESGRKIMELRSERHRVESELAVLTLTVIGAGGDIQNREIMAATRRNPRGRFDYLIRFLAPEEIEGTALLSAESDAGEIEQYLYLPALGMVNRIVGEAQRTPFMGSDFTYEDLRKESTTDYEYAYVGDTRIGNRPVHKVVAVASTPSNRRITGYARRILYIDVESYHVLKIEFFDSSNIHEKTLEAYAFGTEEVEGESIRPHRAVMTNHLRGTTSIMTLRRSRLNIEIDPALFTRDRLKQFDGQDAEELIGTWVN